MEMLAQLLADNPSISFAEAVRIVQDDCSWEECDQICARALERWMDMSESERRHWVKTRATIEDARRVFGL
jgi:hypothetical protein